MRHFDSVISQKEFTEIMNTMSEVFPAINGKARIKYYFDAVKRLPREAFAEISQHFLSSFKNQPMPQDFIDAAAAWKRRNNHFGDAVIEAHVVKCDLCRDSGVIRIIHLSTSDDRLMRCNCDENWRSKDLLMPVFAYQLKQVYKVSACPIEWFKPNDNDPNGKEFQTKLTEYQKRISDSEKYWADLGFKLAKEA